jgi:hypothetical protein
MFYSSRLKKILRLFFDADPKIHGARGIIICGNDMAAMARLSLFR